MELILSFIAGIFVTIVGAYITYLFQRRSEREKDKEKLRFEIYMNLLDIHSSYFWVASAEIRNEKPSPETLKRLHDLTWKTCDKMRQVDNMEYLDNVLDVLLSERFISANERYDAFKEVIEKLHKIVNPIFTKKIKRISQDNFKIFEKRGFSGNNAPGTSI